MHNSLGAPTGPDTPVYCVCKRVALGEMIGCDNDACPYEWFHLPCVNLTKPVDGTWYCPHCVDQMRQTGDPRLKDMKDGFTTFAKVPWTTIVTLAEVEGAG